MKIIKTIGYKGHKINKVRVWFRIFGIPVIPTTQYYITGTNQCAKNLNILKYHIDCVVENDETAMIGI